MSVVSKSTKKAPKRQRYDIDRQIASKADTKWAILSASNNFGAFTTFYENFTTIGQGSSSTTRVGDRLRLKNLSYCITFQNGAAAFGAFGFRAIIFQWFPSTASSPTDTQILTSSDWRAPLRMDTRSQYKVLMDKQEYVIAQSSASHKVWSGTIHIKEPRQIQYEAGITTGTNKLYMILIGSALNGSAAYSVISMTRFYDY